MVKNKTEDHGFKLTRIVRGQVDRPMVIIILLLMCIGSAMVYSASFPYALTKFGDSAYYIRKQLVFVALGVAIMIATSFVDYRLIKNKFILSTFLGLTILFLVLVLFIGSKEGEAKRWLDFKIISFQPSEIAKIAVVFLLAYYFDNNYKHVYVKGKLGKSIIVGTIIPLLILGTSCFLVVLEKHFSGTIIIFLIGIMVIWSGGGKKWLIAPLVIIGVAAVVFLPFYSDLIMKMSFLPDYFKRRIDMWVNPGNYSVRDDIWQTVQGLNAVGSGGLFGRGFGKSLQKHLFVSQPQNDFIFAIVAEEFGFIGCICIIGLYLAFIWRGLYIARRAPDCFSYLTAIGIVAHVGIQAFTNMMVVTSIIPNTGISLPFFSYGGSSLVILLFEMGILLSISRYSRISR